MSVARKTQVVDRHVSLLRTARELGISKTTVLNLAVKGELVAEVVADRTVVTRESLDEYKARRAQEAAAGAE